MKKYDARKVWIRTKMWTDKLVKTKVGMTLSLEDPAIGGKISNNNCGVKTKPFINICFYLKIASLQYNNEN